MSPERFDHLLSLVSPLITKQNTNLRKAIPAGERLALTLRFLAAGESQIGLTFSFRMGKAAVSKIIRETCDAIYTVLAPQYMSPPKTESDWKKIAADFKELWNMPHVICAIDGKHVRMECPANTGTLYHNYKGFFSLVLLAICDAKYCFTYVDVGQYGSNNDSGVLANSEIGLEGDCLKVPDPETLLGCSIDPLPYYLVGDEIFPLKTWLMRPYPGKFDEEQRIFNYRLSRARRVIENSFGILCARWKLFSKPIKASVDNIEKYVLACIALHNYLRLTDNAMYCPQGFVDSENSSEEIKPGEWRKGTDNDIGAINTIANVRGSRYKNDAIEMRDGLKNYVNYSNQVGWQLDHVRRA